MPIICIVKTPNSAALAILPYVNRFCSIKEVTKIAGMYAIMYPKLY